MNTADCELEEFVLSLGFDNLILKEVFVLLKALGTGHPVLDLLVELLFLVGHLDSLLVESVDFLIEFVDGLVFEGVVAVLGI